MKSYDTLEMLIRNLERECRVFCRYLSGQDPSPYVIQKYVEYHRVSGAFADLIPFEQTLIRIATWNTWSTRVADSYCARFAKCSVLRKKLALTVGLLECSPGFAQLIDTACHGPRLLTFLRMGVSVAGSAAALLVSIPVIGTLHLAVGRARKI